MALYNQHSAQRALNQFLDQLAPAQNTFTTSIATVHRRTHSASTVPITSKHKVTDTGSRPYLQAEDCPDGPQVDKVTKIHSPPASRRLSCPSLSSQSISVPLPLAHSVYPIVDMVSMRENDGVTSTQLTSPALMQEKQQEAPERPAEDQQPQQPASKIRLAGPRFGVQFIKSVRPAPKATHLSQTGHLATRFQDLASPCRDAHNMESSVEVPRFKRKELNLGIVNGRGPWRIAWLGLWIWWIAHGLLSIFLDLNIMFTLVQCGIHPSFGASSSWNFAAVAYAVCLGISTLVVWVGWELGYEFWRKWRLPRPAIEPIYFSLPANLHLSLISFDHFVFLTYIRLSSLGTQYERDFFPETCHTLAQLGPGLLPLLPRGAIGVVLILSFDSPQTDIQTSFGATDETRFRDSHYFAEDTPGQLTPYAKTVLHIFIVMIGLRLLLVLASIFGLWMSSGRPLGGLFGFTFARKARQPMVPASRDFTRRVSNQTNPPVKSCSEAETEFRWLWRERARARIQDAFEVCMMRRTRLAGSDIINSIRLLPMEPSPIKDNSANIDNATSLNRNVEPNGTSPSPHISSDPPPWKTGPTSRSFSTGDAFHTPKRTHARVAATELERTSGPSGESTMAFSPRRRREELARCLPSTEGLASTPSYPRHGSLTSSRVQVIERARSTSLTLLKDSFVHGAGIVKRVRSGTILSMGSQYSQVIDKDEEGPPHE